jgi:ABC-type molybdate transport system substrate-binding protein
LLLRAGIIAAFGLASTGQFAQAAEIKVLASVALTSSLDDLKSVYEKETGNQLSIG